MKVELEVPDGHQRPRIAYLPPEPGESIGQEAIDVAKMAGMQLDDWQQWLMIESCRLNPAKSYRNKYTKRIEQKWQTLENVIIVPRQNGKSALYEARELAGLFLWGEKVIIHCAHKFETSAEQFFRVCELIEGVPEFDREIKSVSKTHGAEGIFLKSGQRLLFKTRASGKGRGFSCDCLVLDEAMQLGADAMAALMPTLSARPNPQIFYGGSAGNQDEQDCSQLGRLRSRSLRAIESGEAESLTFAEWSIDGCNDFCPRECLEHADPHSWDSWAQANPGFGVRIDPDFIEAERRTLTPKKFLVERLSVGDYPVEDDAWKVITKEAWERRLDASSCISGAFALGVDVTPDMSHSCIVAAGASLTDGSLEHVEVTGPEADNLDHRPGAGWLAPRIIEIWNRAHPAFVVIDKASPAGGIVKQLENAGVKVVTVNGQEYAHACGEFRTAVKPARGEQPTLVHLGQPSLASALANADKRNLLDMWAWNKRTSTADISPLVAATLAKWGYKTHLYGVKTYEPTIGYLEDLFD